MSTSAITVASTMRRVAARRPGAGCRSCQSLCPHDGLKDAAIAAAVMTGLPHDRDSRGANPEECGIRILYMDTHRKTRRKMHPIECALHVGQAAGDLAIFGEYAEACALYDPVKAVVGMTHQVHVHVHSVADIAEVRFLIVRDHV